MKTQYHWLFYSPTDYTALRRRLNELAEQGLELVKPADGTCYVGRFRPTDRAELRYDVEPRAFCTQEELQRMVDLRAAQGWEPVCTINGVNIYTSMPCHKADFLEDRRETQRRLRPLMLHQLLLCLLPLCFCLPWDLAHNLWYLDYFSLFIHLFGPIVSGAAVLVLSSMLLRLEGPAAVFLQTLFLTLLRLWWLCLPISIVLALLPLRWALGVFLGGIVLRTLLRGNAALFSGLILLFALLVHLLLPAQEMSSLNGMSWRNGRSDIVTAELLERSPEQFISAEYQKTGTLLVRESSYSEKWTDLRIESRLYTCLTDSLAQKVEFTVRQEHPSYTVVSSGKSVLAVWVSEDLSDRELDALAQRIITK